MYPYKSESTVFLIFSSMSQSKDELKYFFALVAEDLGTKSGSKNSLYTKYLSSSTSNQTYDKIFTKLAHLSKGKIKPAHLTYQSPLLITYESLAEF